MEFLTKTAFDIGTFQVKMWMVVVVAVIAIYFFFLKDKSTI